jgi:hypothetical protein
MTMTTWFACFFLTWELSIQDLSIKVCGMSYCNIFILIYEGKWQILLFLEHTVIEDCFTYQRWSHRAHK